MATAVVDPSILCPFCDDHLPPEPSAALRQLLHDTKARAYSEPRPENPFGLHARTWDDLAKVCGQHRFESDVLPRACLEAWPSKVDWDRFKARVLLREALLRPLVDGTDGARDESIFWISTEAQISAGGSRILSPKEQASTFQGHQAG